MAKRKNTKYEMRPGPLPRVSEARTMGRSMAASEFKAKCLSVLDEVSTGHEVVVTKHGKAVAVVKAIHARRGSSHGAWKGLVDVSGDIVHSDWSGEFDVLKD